MSDAQETSRGRGPSGLFASDAAHPPGPGLEGPAPRLHFLSWERPCLPQAVEFLVAPGRPEGRVDLGRTSVALPGARAGRRLAELLVARCEELGLELIPPRIVTVGALPDLFLLPQGALASPLARRLAWTEALRGAPPEIVLQLADPPPAYSDWPAWRSLAGMVERLDSELQAEHLDFSAVVEGGRAVQGFSGQARWRALGKLRAAYLELLAQAGLQDPYQVRGEALRELRIAGEGRVVIVAAPDLNRSLRTLLEALGPRVEILVHAPSDWARRFDSFGCLVPGAWTGLEIPLSEAQLTVAEGPGEQARAALAALASFQGRYSAEEISIGVPDEEVVPLLRQRAQQLGLPTRPTVAARVALTPPCRLLQAVGDFLKERRYDRWAALLRHPDLEAWLDARIRSADPAHARGSLPALLDQYHARHLPLAYAPVWLGGEEEQKRMGRCAAATEALLGPLSLEDQTPGAWATALWGLLMTVYGAQPLDREDPARRATGEALEAVLGVLRGFQELPSQLAPALGITQVLELLLEEVAGMGIPPPEEPGAVELLGWLELHLDDAPALVVTGCNERFIPASGGPDPFLPERLRVQLELPHDDRRWARDVYALRAILASRAEVRLISGRRSARGDPLTPSRLLLACPDADLPRRVRHLFVQTPRAPDPKGYAWIRSDSLRAGASSRFVVPRPVPLKAPLRGLPVTAFRDYLACPYRFYLRHVLSLEVVHDEAEELEPFHFGNLAHQTLEAFGRAFRGKAGAEGGAEGLAGILEELLARRFHDEYGLTPLPAAYLQMQQLRQRLRAFAVWQTRRWEEGWRIVQVERRVEEGEAPLLVDGEPFQLRGRIDRIDRSEATGQYAILDYKTSERGESPEKAHRKAGVWIDLQLPLYRHLVRGLGLGEAPLLGYIALPKDPSKCGAQVAGWSEEDLASADACACQVVRDLRAERFWPPADPPSSREDDYGLLCNQPRSERG